MTTTSLPAGLRRAAWPIAGAIALTTLTACHTTPPRNAQLEEAQRVFQDASASPDVTSHAALELDRARKTLYQAQEAWHERRDEKEASHLAYLATQQSKVAINIGMQHAADNIVTAAGADRDRIQAQASSQEAQNARANAQVATQRADALEQELKQLSAQHTNRGLMVMLQDVLFDVGKAELRSGATARLQRLADIVKNHPERRLLVEGFTDSTGSAELNQTLSEQRAQAVKDALTGMGVAADRIDTKGFGKDRPLASNKTAAGRQQNRRVEVVFSDASGTFSAQ